METNGVGVENQYRHHAKNVDDKQNHGKSNSGEEQSVSDKNSNPQDSVEISDWARQLFDTNKRNINKSSEEVQVNKNDTDNIIVNEKLKAQADFRSKAFLSKEAANYFSDFVGSLDGKVEKSYDIMNKLYDTLNPAPSNQMDSTNNPFPQLTYDYFATSSSKDGMVNIFDDLERQAAQREDGKKLAEYIAQNYFDDPDEAKAFMDKVNEVIADSEKRDEERLNLFTNRMEMIEAMRNEVEAAVEASGGKRTDPEEAEARIRQMYPEYDPSTVKTYDEIYKDAVGESSIQDWFAGLINNARQSINNTPIENLLGKYGIFNTYR